MLPFTQAEFFAVFADYNRAIWPAQVVAYAAGWLAVWLSGRKEAFAHRLVWGLAAAMWAWTGIAYHGLWFARINPIGWAFAVAFVAQAGLFVFFGVVRGRLRFGRVAPLRSFIGFAAILYAAILYPAIGVLSGHAYPAMPTFGVTPCPLVIFTLGLMLLARVPNPLGLLSIPLAWSALGGFAALRLGVPQDWMLPLAGALTAALLLWPRRRPIFVGLAEVRANGGAI